MIGSLNPLVSGVVSDTDLIAAIRVCVNCVAVTDQYCLAYLQLPLHKLMYYKSIFRFKKGALRARH